LSLPAANRFFLHGAMRAAGAVFCPRSSADTVKVNKFALRPQAKSRHTGN